MRMSICKFHVKGWLSSEPKVVHLLDKDGIEYMSAVVRISIPRIRPDKECTFKQRGYNIISVSVHGSAAEQIEKDAADLASAGAAEIWLKSEAILSQHFAGRHAAEIFSADV